MLPHTAALEVYFLTPIVHFRNERCSLLMGSVAIFDKHVLVLSTSGNLLSSCKEAVICQNASILGNHTWLLMAALGRISASSSMNNNDFLSPLRSIIIFRAK